jgi:hypothetical protein
MKKLLSILALALLASASTVQAGELDNEGQISNAKAHALDLPQTVVVRKDADGTVSVLHSTELLPAGPVKFDDSKFVKMASNAKMKGELDGDSSSGNWFFYWGNNNYFYPTFNYWGYNYNYQPYYNYYNNYNYSNYYFYRWFW